MPEPYTGEERRAADAGPPAGTPERRRSRLPTYDNRVTLGSLIQSATIALSVIGAAIAAIFASGAYVQHLRDDLLVAQEKVARTEAATNERLFEALQRMDRSKQ